MVHGAATSNTPRIPECAVGPGWTGQPEEDRHLKGTGMEPWSAEVWSQYSQTWMPGFDVVDETERGYRLRRRTDGAMLPTDIAKADVRHEGHEA